MIKGIKGLYSTYVPDAEGYSFDIFIEKNISINGKGFQTAEIRDDEARRIAKELNIILTNE